MAYGLLALLPLSPSCPVFVAVFLDFFLPAVLSCEPPTVPLSASMPTLESLCSSSAQQPRTPESRIVRAIHHLSQHRGQHPRPLSRQMQHLGSAESSNTSLALNSTPALARCSRSCSQRIKASVHRSRTTNITRTSAAPSKKATVQLYVSQIVPAQARVHEHAKPLARSVHVPPCSQGSAAQSSRSYSHTSPANPDEHSHRYASAAMRLSDPDWMQIPPF